MKLYDAHDFNPFDRGRYATGMDQFGAVLAAIVMVPIALVGLAFMASGEAAGGLVVLGSLLVLALFWISRTIRVQRERRWHAGLRHRWHASSDIGWATYLSGLHALEAETCSAVALLRCGDDFCVFNSRRKVLSISVADIASVGVGSESATFSEWDSVSEMYIHRDGVATDLLEIRLRAMANTATFRMAGNNDVHRWKDILSRPD